MLQLKKSVIKEIVRSDKQIICFGAGALAEFMLCSYQELLRREDLLFVDNNAVKDGMFLCINNKKVPIYSLEHFKQSDKKDFILIIVPVFFQRIVEQLDRDSYFNGIETYLYPLLSAAENQEKVYSIKNTDVPLIPKVIHYCWFGKQEIPDNLKRIMKSWKEKCPEYKIIRWDESNYDVKKNKYMYEAYQKGCYAYVSDYARKDILYQYGGIYLDTDVEILRDIDDLRYNKAFACVDDAANVASGAGMGSIAGLPLVKELMKDYDEISFIRKDGSLNMEPSGVNETRFLLKKGFRQQGGYQMIQEMSIFPREVMLPESWCALPDIFTKNTYMVHRFQKYIYGYRSDNVNELKADVEKILKRCKE